MWKVKVEREIDELRLEVILRRDGGNFMLMSSEATEPLAMGILTKAEAKKLLDFIKTKVTLEEKRDE